MIIGAQPQPFRCISLLMPQGEIEIVKRGEGQTQPSLRIRCGGNITHFMHNTHNRPVRSLPLTGRCITRVDGHMIPNVKIELLRRVIIDDQAILLMCL